MLLEQAFRIKEEVAAGLQSTHGSIQVEALSRKLLENHILTITRIVKQLNVDIQVYKWEGFLKHPHYVDSCLPSFPAHSFIHFSLLSSSVLMCSTHTHSQTRPQNSQLI